MVRVSGSILMKALLVSLSSSAAVITVSPNASLITFCSAAASPPVLFWALSVCAGSAATVDVFSESEEFIRSALPQAARDTIIPAASSAAESFLHLLFNEAIFPQPLCDLTFGRIPVILGGRAGNGKAILHCAARNVGNGGFSIGKSAAAVGTERNNGLAG